MATFFIRKALQQSVRRTSPSPPLSLLTLLCHRSLSTTNTPSPPITSGGGGGGIKPWDAEEVSLKKRLFDELMLRSSDTSAQITLVDDHYKRAVSMYKEFAVRRVKMTALSFNSVLSLAIQCRDWPFIVQLVEDQLYYHELPAYTNCYVIRAYAMLGDLGSSQRYLEVLKQRTRGGGGGGGKLSDEYNELAVCQVEHDDFTGGFATIRTAFADGCTINDKVCAQLVNTLCQQAAAKKAQTVLLWFLKNQPRAVTTTLCNEVIRCYIAHERIADAETLYDTVMSGSTPQVPCSLQTYQLFIDVYQHTNEGLHEKWKKRRRQHQVAHKT